MPKSFGNAAAADISPNRLLLRRNAPYVRIRKPILKFSSKRINVKYLRYSFRRKSVGTSKKFLCHLGHILLRADGRIRDE